MGFFLSFYCILIEKVWKFSKIIFAVPNYNGLSPRKQWHCKVLAPDPQYSHHQHQTQQLVQKAAHNPFLGLRARPHLDFLSKEADKLDSAEFYKKLQCPRMDMCIPRLSTISRMKFNWLPSLSWRPEDEFPNWLLAKVIQARGGASTASFCLANGGSSTSSSTRVLFQ